MSKQFALIFAMLGLVTLALAAPGAPAAVSVTARGLILIDPGHGGTDDSGVVIGNGHEAAVVLALALALEKSLKEQGWQVLLTRRSDETLSITARVALANQSGALAFISLHVNHSFNASVGGPRIFVAAESATNASVTAPRWEEAASAHLPESKRLAQSLASALGVKGLKAYQSLRLAQFRGLVIPGALLELDYASQTGRAAVMLGEAWSKDLVERLTAGLNGWAGNVKP